MTGLELLEGLSFVDERFIAEADTAKLGRNVPWMKLLSVAACLCILIVGAFALENFGHKGAMESITEEAAPEAAAPQAETQAAVEEATPMEPECAAPVQETAAEESLTEDVTGATDELQHIPCATLRILSVEDDHWVAVVEEISDEPSAFAVGMQVTVMIDTAKIPETDRSDEAMFGGILLPEEGLLAKIEDGAYDASANILYIAGANLEKPAEEG